MLITECNKQRKEWARTIVKITQAEIKEMEADIPLYGWTSSHKNVLKNKRERLAHFQELAKD